MLDYSLNISGSEWMIIVFVAIVLVLGTGKLPSVAKKLGKAVNEYNKAKNEIQEQMKIGEEQSPKITGPVGTEREKLETMAKSMGVNVKKSDDELRKMISEKMGQKKKEEEEENSE